MAHEHVKVEVRGDTQAAALFQQGAEQGFIVQDQVAGVFVRQQFNQSLRGACARAQRRNHEFNVLGRELNPAVGLNHIHTHVIAFFQTN